MEEYISTLLEQIRCKKARVMVGKEIRSHVEEQIEDNKVQGMNQEEAVREAVRDMGDPVEAGVFLDRIHRPQMNRSVILVMLVISLLSILIHVMIGLGEEALGGYSGADYISRAILHVGTGFAMMLVVYRLDYSFMARYAKIVGGVFLGFLFLQIFFFGVTYHGAVSFMRIGRISVSITYSMLLYIPIYGALLYQYRGTGVKGIFKAMIWMLLPVGMVLRVPSLSMALNLLFIMSVLISIAVWKGWFLTARKSFLIAYWSLLILLPVIWVTSGIKLKWFADYQIARIMRYFGGVSAYDYRGELLIKYRESSRFFGGNGEAISGMLPEYNSVYLLTFLSSYYGTAAALVICCLLGFIVIKAFRISIRQKNQLGMIMGCGCGFVFLMNIVLNLAMNFELLPVTQTFLPFFSFGGTSMIVSYLLTGIILSIYRYQNILPVHLSKERQRKHHLVKREIRYDWPRS